MKRKIISIVCLITFIVCCFCSCTDSDVHQTSQNPSGDVSTNTLNTTESTSKLESTEKPNEEQTKVDHFVGKTLGELEANGYEYSGYIAFGSEYTFDYRTETRIYEVAVDVPEEAKKALDDIDFFDDDREEKEKAIRSTLIVKAIEVVNGEPISESELSKYVGEKASVLIADGFKVSGFSGYNGQYTLFFTKDRQCYYVELDESANAILDESEFGDDSYKTKILNSIVMGIKYDSPF